jgi:hypothetical protein
MVRAASRPHVKGQFRRVGRHPGLGFGAFGKAGEFAGDDGSAPRESGNQKQTPMETGRRAPAKEKGPAQPALRRFSSCLIEKASMRG